VSSCHHLKIDHFYVRIPLRVSILLLFCYNFIKLICNLFFKLKRIKTSTIVSGKIIQFYYSVTIMTGGNFPGIIGIYTGKKATIYTLLINNL